jgi:hypothetical protein
MRSFRYPEIDHELLDREYVRDFLRDPDDFPDRVDFNYLRNQRDSANHFLDWFDGTCQGSFVEMLSKCHEHASFGRSKSSVYTINWTNTILIPFLSMEGTIQFKTSDSGAFRETHPGVFRSELVDRGIQHPTVDIFELTREEFDVLAALGEQSFGADLEWCSATSKASRRTSSSGCYRIGLEGTKDKLEVIITETGHLERHNPSGHVYEKMKALCEARISQIREHWYSKSPHSLSTLIAQYYHTAINWMPFSNINNSILMAHMNSLRRCLGIEPLAHRNLDTYALLTSSSGFSCIINEMDI